MNYHVICNPTSGNGIGKAIGEKTVDLLHQAGLSCTCHHTAFPMHAVQLTKEALAAGADAVIAVGGDGTLHEVAQSLAGTDTPLGIIAAGTGNDFIKTLHIPADTEQALDIILHSPPRPVDTVRINDRLFINECGCGFDVMVLDYAEKAKKVVKGILPYLHGVIQTILHYHDTRVRYSVDGGEVREENLLVMAIGNGRFIGGGIPIAPHAVPDDGRLDFLTISSMTRSRMFSVLPGLLKGKIEEFPETTHRYIQRLHIWGDRLRVNIDGEILTLDEAEISIRPASLMLYRPAEGETR